MLVGRSLPDLPFGGFLEELDRLPFRPLVIMMESSPQRLWDAELYRSLGTGSAVNKWHPCEVLRAANEALCSQSRLVH